MPGRPRNYLLSLNKKTRRSATPRSMDQHCHGCPPTTSAIYKIPERLAKCCCISFWKPCASLLPQIMAKMDLKTNPKMELHGSDGIHIKWNSADDCLDLYFGEAKLEKSVTGALKHAFESIEHFHSDGLRDHEFGLVTAHYKHADDTTRAAVCKFVDRSAPGGDCRINHACLIGYDWVEYRKLDTVQFKDLEVEFKRRYAEDAPRLQRLLAD